MRHSSERLSSSPHAPSASKQRSNKTTAIAAIATGVISAIGAQGEKEAQAEPLQFNNYAACLGTGPTNLRGMTMNATLDSDDPLGTVAIKGNQFLDSWNYGSNVDKSLIAERLVFDGKNYYGIYRFPGEYDDATGKLIGHPVGFYFFRIPTTVVNDYSNKESVMVTGKTDKEALALYSTTITKLPNGETAYEVIQLPELFTEDSTSIKRFKPTFDTSGVMNGLTYTGIQQQIKDLLPGVPDNNINTMIFGEYLVITELVADTNNYFLIHICKKDPTTGQYAKPQSAKFTSKDSLMVSPNQWTLNQAYYKDCNGKKSVVFTKFAQDGKGGVAITGDSIQINLDDPDDQTTIKNQPSPYIVDDEGRFRAGDTYNYASSTVTGMLWTDIKTKKTATTPKGINGKIISYMGKYENQGQWVRLWATYNQIWMLVGDDITKIQYKDITPILPEGINDMACIGMQQHYPTLTPKPVEQSPEQIEVDGPDTKDTMDSGETANTGDADTIGTNKDTDANSEPDANPQSDLPIKTDIVPTGDTAKETEPTAEPTPEKEDTSNTTESSTVEEESDANIGSDDTNGTTEDTDTTGTPLINDTNQPTDTAIQQQPPSTNSGCNVGERVSPNSPLGLAIIAAAMGAITMSRRTKATSRERIRREIEEVLEK